MQQSAYNSYIKINVAKSIIGKGVQNTWISLVFFLVYHEAMVIEIWINDHSPCME